MINVVKCLKSMVSRECVSDGDLRTHIRTVHEITQDFPCDQCSKVFKMDDVLGVRIKTVHLTSQELSCDKCNKPFGIGSDLSAHVKAVHRELILVLY